MSIWSKVVKIAVKARDHRVSSYNKGQGSLGTGVVLGDKPIRPNLKFGRRNVTWSYDLLFLILFSIFADKAIRLTSVDNQVEIPSRMTSYLNPHLYPSSTHKPRRSIPIYVYHFLCQLYCCECKIYKHFYKFMTNCQCEQKRRRLACSKHHKFVDGFFNTSSNWTIHSKFPNTFF